MLFRIDLERFLTHAIDHFTRDELIQCNYAILGTLKNGDRCRSNVVKINLIYPSSETQNTFLEYENKEVFRKMYFEDLDITKNLLYRYFINPTLLHQNIMIVCRESENYIVDVLAEYLMKNFKVDCINLNDLFIKGKVGPFYIDRDKIHNTAVDIRRETGKEEIEALGSTRDGRMKLLRKMKVSEKIKKLKELSIKINKSELKDIDKILIDAWVEDD